MKDLPEFMELESKRHIHRSMTENPELWVSAALYSAMGLDEDGERFALVMQADEVKRAKSIAEWLHEVSAYDASSLRRGGKNRSENPDLPARSLFLLESIVKLMEIIGAPHSLIEDLRHLTRRDQPIAAQRRAKMQAILISRPELSERKAADIIAYDPTLLGEDIEAKRIFRLPKV